MKKFVGESTYLQGKVFELTVIDVVHQFAETVKEIVDFVGQDYMHEGDTQFIIFSGL